MRDLLKKVFTNVEIKDEDGKVLLNQSNLFVESGRGLIRDILKGDVTLDVTKFVLEFGDSSQVPAEADVDIVTPFNPVISQDLPTKTAVSTTEIDFAFAYTSGAGVTFKEMGLFYRPAGAPSDGGVPPRADSGVLLARLKTTYTSITIGAAKTVTITWKIIF